MGKLCMSCMDCTMTWLPDYYRWKCGNCGYEDFPRDFQHEHLDAAQKNKIKNFKENRNDNQQQIRD